ncbi:MAG: SusC/RagA family TonB-linked outer membrane protein [Bacteroidales bacterium]|nr:SusC/RagA family TonB-linked outer membrane protein [Bacteroidales bacterium]
MKKAKLFFSALFVLISMSVFAQNITVKGTVKDASTGEAIPFAAVQVKGTSTGTSTDADGVYSISVASRSSLIFSSIGYDSVEIEVAGRNTLDVALNPDRESLENAVVVAFGTKRKQDLVGSVSSVKSELLQNNQAASVTSALEGAVAGLQVITSTGQPGSDASIYVRGIGSLSASNAALVVLDGVPYNGSISNINPQDIESITVSKDAVSNSLYGSRAAGGVVMITTKSGAKTRTNIQFSASAGVLSRAYKDYAMVTDPGEYYRLTWYGIRNTEITAGATADEAALTASESLLDELGNYNAFIIPNGEYLVDLNGNLNKNARVRYNDSFADNMFKTAVRQEYNVSASGSNDKVDYYLSVGYLDNQSYIVGSSYNRLSARANVNAQLTKWLRAGMNIGYSKTQSNGMQESTSAASNPFSVARSWAPIYPVHAFDANGNMVMENGVPVWDAGTGQTAGTSSRPVATNQNVICNLYEDIRRTSRHNLTTRTYVEAKFLKHFTAMVNYSYDFRAAEGLTYYTPTIGDGQSFGGRGTHSATNTSVTNIQETLAYDNIFGDNHSFSAKIGHEYYTYHTHALEGQKTNFFDPSNPELNNGGPMQYLESATNDLNIEGFFGMVDYNYASRYYLSAAFRRDGTSRFLKKWGNFWSVGAGWRLSAEPWMANSKNWLDDLKFRASYGTQGNQEVGNYYPAHDQYAISWDGSALGYSYSYYGNPEISWEKQNTFDVGVDFSFLGRIRGNVDYFIRYTDDMLFQRPLAYSTGGRPYKWENIGAMQNSGIEFELNFDLIKNRDLRWTLSLIGSHYANKIVRLPEENREDGITSGTFKLMEGRDRYEYFVRQYAGMDENGNSQWWMDTKDENGNVTGQEKTTTYTDATKYYIGKTALPALDGGVNTQLYWKGLDFSIQTSYRLGGWAYDSEYLDGMSISYYVGHSSDMWKTYDPVKKTGDLPVWNSNNSSNSYSQTSDAHLVSASFFNIRNITLGYTLPKNVTRKFYVEGLRFFVMADNLALISARQGFDPRVSFTGSTSSFGGYAPMRTISGGITVTF